LDAALQLPKDELTIEKTSCLIKKFFQPEKAGSESLKQEAEGLASVVILHSGQTGGDLSKCIAGIRKHTPEPHELILVPTGPHADTDSLKQIAKDNKYIILKSKFPLTYPEACNKSFAEAKGEYVVILNDDVVVTEGWLSYMLEQLESGSDIGIVAPMTVNVEGPQGVHRVRSGELRVTSGEKARTQEDSLRLFETDGQLEEFAKAFRERNRHRRIETINLSGFCMLFRREMVKKIGFMDERLEIPDFADNDYCLRAAIEGYRNIIAGDVFVHTHRNRTLAGRGGKFG
jgi:GT2 family glycosyltransferase